MKGLIYSTLLCLGIYRSATSSAAVDAPTTRDYQVAAAEYARRDPVAEATENFRKGRIVFLVSQNFSWPYFHGLENFHDPGYERFKGYKIESLKWFSDGIDGEEHANYMRAASKFASAYNRQMAKLLPEKQTK